MSKKIKLTPSQITLIDRYIVSEMKRQHIPGLVLGIYNHGHVLLAKGYGVGDIRHKVQVNPKMIFQLGSIGKQFVSAAIMILVEQHKIRLDDSITKYFPTAPKSWDWIKIKNLLSHTSGLAEYGSKDLTGPGGLFYKLLDFSEDEAVKKIQKLPIMFKSGERWQYSNTNYVLLGIIIHKITGKFWFEYVKEMIFKPLDMKSVRLVHKTDTIKNCSLGYELHRNRPKNAEWWSDTYNSFADGCFYCNILDLAQWDEALYSTKLLKQSSLNKIWTVFKLNNGKPNQDNYGFGWHIRKINNHKVIEHDGEWQGFESHIARYVDDGITVVVLDNLEPSDPTPITHKVAWMINPKLIPS